MAELFHSLPLDLQQALLEGPAIPAPPGVVPNFDNPPNSRKLGLVVLIMTFLFCALSLAVRMYSRVFYAKRIWTEDYLAMAAFGVFVSFEYFVLSMAIKPGFFTHTWDFRLKDLSSYLYHIMVMSSIHGVILSLLKSAILLDLARFFAPRGQKNLLFWTCHALLWANIIFYTICTFLEIFGCQPREKLWNKLLPSGRCINMSAVVVASGAVNLVSDLCILLLPQRTIWRLKLTTKRKCGLSTIFAVAVFACVSAAYRLAKSVPLLLNNDVAYNFSHIGLWIQAEITAGFLVAGVPASAKIFQCSPTIQALRRQMRSWTGFSAENESTKKFSSWHKATRKMKPHQGSGWTDLERTEDDEFLMQSLKSVHAGHQDESQERVGH